MKKTTNLLFALALVIALLAGCGGTADTPPAAGSGAQGAALSGSVSTNGSTSMEKIIGVLGEQFMADNGGVTVTYDATGSGTGVNAALAVAGAIG